MATIKQRVAVSKIVENRGNISKAMKEAGYPAITAKNPKNLTESKGFKEVCKELGLNDDLIVCSLVSDIKAKPKNRVRELELAAKMTGILNSREEDKGNVFNQFNILVKDQETVEQMQEKYYKFLEGETLGK